MLITHILLDLDGTLTDPKLGITKCIQHALTTLGCPAPEQEELVWCIGPPPLRQSFKRLLRTEDPERVERAMSLYRDRFTAVGMFENRLYPDTIPALKAMRQAGYRTLLATCKPRVYAEPILRHFGIEDQFDAIHGSELDGRLTSKQELIAHILSVETLAPLQVIMVGDREDDVLGAKRNGVLAAGVTYGYGSEAELLEAGGDLLFDSLPALVNFLLDGHRVLGISPVGVHQLNPE